MQSSLIVIHVLGVRKTFPWDTIMWQLVTRVVTWPKLFPSSQTKNKMASSRFWLEFEGKIYLNYLINLQMSKSLSLMRSLWNKFDLMLASSPPVKPHLNKLKQINKSVNSTQIVILNSTFLSISECLGFGKARNGIEIPSPPYWCQAYTNTTGGSISIYIKTVWNWSR